MATGDVERVLAFARRAEDLGFDGVFAFDHLFPPGAAPHRPSLEAYATLAAIASTTSRVRIGTLVTRASLRSAGMLARQAATLDDVSDGRFVLGIGTGDTLGRAEHEVFGLPYLAPTTRRDHLAETIRAVRALLLGEPWLGGVHVPPIDGPLLPGPRTTGGPAIWVGGASAGAVQVAAHQADGWNGWGLAASTVADRAVLLASEAGGRAVEPTWGGAVVVAEDATGAERMVADRRARGLDQAWAGSADSAAAWLLELRDAGATWAILLAAGSADRVELIARHVLPAFREAA